MTHEEAISECRRVYRVEGARWPVPLIAFLDEPPDERRVFGWLTSCVGDLLGLLGQSDTRLEGALDLARQTATEGTALEPVERQAWELWSGRVTGGVARTAVAQLLFALSAYRERRETRLGSCATPVILLDQLASSQGGLLEQVVSHFTAYVSGPCIA